METWFWQKRHRNDSDTSTEGMLAFFHCVRILENDTEEGWHKHMETENDDFPLTIPMERIWEWFYAYKRLYELNYKRLTTPNIRYPESRKPILKKICMPYSHPWSIAGNIPMLPTKRSSEYIICSVI